MYSNENIINRIHNILCMPLLQKCEELNGIIEHCPLRDLQDAFTTIVHSIFGVDTGSEGWGLRTITEEYHPHQFEVLHNFFGVDGAMVRLCHRLITDTVKYDINVDLLPHKLVAMLQSGQHSLFYTDLLNVDPFRRNVVSLSLNSFDFYMLHFVLHALQPLHRINPLALQIHNDRLKSVYYILTADYLNNYMPTRIDVEVLPTNISFIPKTVPPIQNQSLQPNRAPRYLKIPSSYDNNSVSPTNVNMEVGGPRTHIWRTESVLNFFIDVWLRFDIEGEHDLPGSEFVRNIRVLIKQTHFFANTAMIDITPMAQLRKMAHPMIKAQIYPFLRSLIDRWPLDSSMSVVLELWLCYIQPWRYNLNYHDGRTPYEPCITSQFENFIADNLLIYTHIFWRILPRFERLDYSVYKNAFMLYRLTKVWSQPGLSSRIEEIEKQNVGNSFACDSPHRFSTYFRNNTSNGNYNQSFNTVYNEAIPNMFSESMCKEMENFLNTVNIARISMMRDIRVLEDEIKKKKQSQSFLTAIFNRLFGKEPEEEYTLKDVSRIPEMLKQSISSFSYMFHINLSDVSIDEACLPEQNNLQQSFSFVDNSAYLNLSKITPYQMCRNVATIHHCVDPALSPIKFNEISLLVRIFHIISTKINTKFGDKLQEFYLHNDIVGKIFQQVLYPPIKVQRFDKSRGCSVLCEDELPARLCLRPLASLPVIFVTLSSMFIGYIIWSAPFFGLLTLIFLCACYSFIMALIS